MNALWVEELDIDDENILSRILKKMDIDSQKQQKQSQKKLSEMLKKGNK